MRTLPAKLARIVMSTVVTGALFAAATAQATPVRYVVDSAIADARVLGTITTDGTFGYLGRSNITAFDFFIFDAATTYHFSETDGTLMMRDSHTLFAAPESLWLLADYSVPQQEIIFNYVQSCDPILAFICKGAMWRMEQSGDRSNPFRGVMNIGIDGTWRSSYALWDTVIGKVPEPNSLALGALALAATSWSRRRRAN